MLGLSIATSEKLLRGQHVDRGTIQVAFQRLGLPLQHEHLIEPQASPSEEPPLSPTEDETLPRDHDEQKPLRDEAHRRKRLRGVVGIATCAVFVALAALHFAQPAKTPTKRVRDADAIYQQGLALYGEGRLDEAEAVAKELIALVRVNKSADALGTALRLSGDVSHGKGDYESALSSFGESLTVWKRLGKTNNVAELYEALGNTSLRAGKLEEAQANFESSHRLYSSLNHAVGLGMAHRGLGSVALARKNPKEARRQFALALKTIAPTDAEPMKMDLRGRLALCLAEEGQRAKAVEELMVCLEYWKNRNAQRWVAIMYQQIGEIHMKEGSFSLARTYFELSLTNYRKVGDKAGTQWVKSALSRLPPRRTSRSASGARTD